MSLPTQSGLTCCAKKASRHDLPVITPRLHGAPAPSTPEPPAPGAQTVTCTPPAALRRGISGNACTAPEGRAGDRPGTRGRDRKTIRAYWPRERVPGAADADPGSTGSRRPRSTTGAGVRTSSLRLVYPCFPRRIGIRETLSRRTSELLTAGDCNDTHRRVNGGTCDRDPLLRREAVRHPQEPPAPRRIGWRPCPPGRGYRALPRRSRLAGRRDGGDGSAGARPAWGDSTVRRGGRTPGWGRTP
jgi:hypothetical protein